MMGAKRLMAEIYKATFQLRRGSAEVWKMNNPILKRGEPGFVIDENKLKIGDGVTPWNDLKYIDNVADLSEYLSEKPGEICEGKTFSVHTGELTDTKILKFNSDGSFPSEQKTASADSERFNA